MIDDIKLLLGDRASNYTDAQISLCLKMAQSEVEEYCNRELDTALEIAAQKITIIKLNRLDTEGITAESYNGVSQSYLDGYPEDIMSVLRKKRKIKVI